MIQAVSPVFRIYLTPVILGPRGRNKTVSDRRE
jgi:hypothetical protein